jgi:hypothetical protein
MSTVAVLGLVWALVGVPLVVRVVQDRRPLPMEEFHRAMGALSGPGPTPSGPVPGAATSVQAAARRRLISTLTFSPGLSLTAVGVVLQDASVIAVGLCLVNLGTLHRLIALGVDQRHPRPVVLGGPAPSSGMVNTIGTPTTPAMPTFGPAPIELAASERAIDPGVDEGAGDAQLGGYGWQIVSPEPARVDDLVLVDADVS